MDYNRSCCFSSEGGDPISYCWERLQYRIGTQQGCKIYQNRESSSAGITGTFTTLFRREDGYITNNKIFEVCKSTRK